LNVELNNYKNILKALRVTGVITRREKFTFVITLIAVRVVNLSLTVK